MPTDAERASPKALHAEVASEIERARAEAHALVHTLWSRARELPHYDKTAWSALALHVETLSRYAHVPPPPSQAGSLARRAGRFVGTVALSLSVIVVLGTLASSTTHTPPDNAVVLVNDHRREFIPPPFTETSPALEREFIRELSYAEARAQGYTLEASCRRTGCWIQPGRSGLGTLLERMHVLPTQRSRWTEDGRWRW